MRYLRKCFILSASLRADPESSRILRVNVRTGRSAAASVRRQTRTPPAVELRGCPRCRRKARAGARSPGLALLRAGGRPTPSNLCVTLRSSEPVQGGLARLKAAEKRVGRESCTLGLPGAGPGAGPGSCQAGPGTFQAGMMRLCCSCGSSMMTD